jgi:hypothetical protein
MNIEPINIEKGAAIVIMLRTSEKWGAQFSAPAKNNRAAVEAFAELIETAFKLDEYGAGPVSRYGDWEKCVFLAPIRPGCEDRAKHVAKNLIEKAAVAERGDVASIEAGVFKKQPEWNLDEFVNFCQVFADVVATAGARLQAEIKAHDEKMADLFRQLDDATRQLRELQERNRDGEDKWKEADPDDDGDEDGGSPE